MLLHVGQQRKDEVQDIAGDQFTLDLDLANQRRRGTRIQAAALVADGHNLAHRHAVRRAGVLVRLEEIARVKFAVFQVPTQGPAGIDRPNADEMQEHLLHQIFLNFRIARQLRRDPLQLSDNQVLSHVNNTVPSLARILRDYTSR